MATPTFDSHAVFSSVTSDALATTILEEGTLLVEGYTGIIQKIHFEGEDGDRHLSHGYPSRTWKYRGLLSAPTLDGLNGLLVILEEYVDLFITDPTTYFALVDSFGNSYEDAAILTVDPTNLRKTDSGYCLNIVVTGIIQTMEQDG